MKGKKKMKTVKELLEDLMFQGFGILSYTQSAGLCFLYDYDVRDMIDSGEIEGFDFYEEDDKDEIIENINSLFYERVVGIYGDVDVFCLAVRRFKNDKQFLLLPALD